MYEGIKQGRAFSEEDVQDNYIDEEIENYEKEDERELEGKISDLLRSHPRLTNVVGAVLVTLSINLATRAGYELIQDNFGEYINVSFPRVESSYTTGNYPKPSAAHQELLNKLGAKTPWVHDVSYVDSVTTPGERKELVEIPLVPRIKGFEKFELSNEIIEKILVETMPKGLLRNINSIEYVNDSEPMQLAYGIKLVESSETAGSANDWSRSIEIFRTSKGQSKSFVAHHLLPHEIFHLNDSDSNYLLTIDERIELYDKLMKRLESPDRFKSSYVEKISNADKKMEVKIKLDEYFAEIGEAYLSEDYHLLPLADKKIVEEFISKIDPEFNRLEALNKRRLIIGEKPPVVKTLEEITAEEMRWVTSVDEYIKMLTDTFAEAGKEITPKAKADIERIAQEWHEEGKKRAVKNAATFHKQLQAHLRSRGEI